MEDKRVAKFGYEELSKDLELEIFGLKFGIGISEDYLKKISNIEYNDDGSIRTVIDSLLGEDAFNKISEKYKKDQEKEIDEFVWVKVVLFIKQEFEKFMNSYQENFKDEKNNFRQMNREQRRSNRYRKNYNRGYNYRRY